MDEMHEIDRTYQKFCTQTTDGRNIFTYCFQPIQRLHPNFATNGIEMFMAQQKQRKQLIF